MEKEREHAENGEPARLVEEEEAYVDDHVGRQEYPDEDAKDLASKAIRAQYIAKHFKEKEENKKAVLGLRDLTVLKMPRILQSVFYLLQYKRQDVCQPGTNKFNWKLAKTHFDETFLEKMAAYSPLGLRRGPTQIHYTTLNFIEKNLEGLVQEDVEAQCGHEIARLFRWVSLCVKTRKEDVLYRKNNRKKALMNRETLIQKEQERQLKMQADIAEAEAKFNEENKEQIDAVNAWDAAKTGTAHDEYGEEDGEEDAKEAKEEEPKERPEMPVFNKDEFLKGWLEENPVIEIPSEEQVEADADWVLSEEEEQAALAAYLASKEQQ